MGLHIKGKDACRFDLAALGEVMLRLDPGRVRVRCARHFDVWEGGGEYNVARALSKCFGLETTVVTALAENEVGYLIEDFIQQGGVDTSFIQWVPFDGVGRKVRNGLNFTEQGFGRRRTLGTSDRGLSAASQMGPKAVDWDRLFGELGVRWFHTGGIFCGLSEISSHTAIAAVRAAKKYGTIVSYDLNYRASLWKDVGGIERAREVNQELAPLVDLLFGTAEEFQECLGLDVPENLSGDQAYKALIEAAASRYPNLRMVASIKANEYSSTLNDYSALAWHEGVVYRAPNYERVEIYDRVGAGDSFSSGLIYGMLAKNDPAQAVRYGIAHAALTSTTPGDNSMARLWEVETLMAGGDVIVER